MLCPGLHCVVGTDFWAKLKYINLKNMLVSHLSCSNKESDPEKYALKLKQHSGGIHHCQYSCDGSRVLSCSSMGDVKVCVGGGG